MPPLQDRNFSAHLNLVTCHGGTLLAEHGEIVEQHSYIEEHPASYDQDKSIASEMLGKSKAFLFAALVPTDNEDEFYLHTMIGREPGLSTAVFSADAIMALIETAGTAVTEEAKWDEENDKEV